MSSTEEIGVEAVDGILEHFGKKGMKWGVRNDAGHEGEQVKTKKLDKLDKQWEKDNTGVSGYIKVHNAVADRMNNGMIDDFNNEPRWAAASEAGHLMDDNHPETKAYFEAYETLTNKTFAEEGVKLGMNPSGTKQYQLTSDDQGNPYAYLGPVKQAVQHAEGSSGFALKINRDSLGFVTSVTDTELSLMHFGKKGMKWGVRNDASGSGTAAAPKERGKIKRGATKANTALNAGAKVIAEGESKLIFLPQKNRDKAASATQTQVLGAAIGVNRSAQFKGKDLKRDPELKAEYFRQVEAAAKKIYADELGIARTEAWADFLGTTVDTTGMRITAASNRIRHANEGQETLLVLKWTLDELGQISDVTVPPGYLTHDEELGLALTHYGKKGMKWGVTTVDKSSSPTLTREKKALRNTKDVTVTQRKSGKYVQTKGGQRQKATDDAVKAHAGRQKAKKSTTDALTNDELKAVVERMRLEQEYAKLDAKVVRRGSGFISQLFQSPAARSTTADLLKRSAESNKKN